MRARIAGPRYGRAMVARRFPTMLVAAALVAACKSEDPAPGPAPEAKPLAVEIVAAPASGDVQEIVRGELARARGDGRPLLVYVGAAWCEPCQRFHQAAQAGQVDALFPGLRL